jgi:hypothetical protein
MPSLARKEAIRRRLGGVLLYNVRMVVERHWWFELPTCELNRSRRTLVEKDLNPRVRLNFITEIHRLASQQLFLSSSTSLAVPMPPHYRPPPPKSASRASASTLCQKCLKRDTSSRPPPAAHNSDCRFHGTTATNAPPARRSARTRPARRARSSSSTRSSCPSSPTTRSTS